MIETSGSSKLVVAPQLALEYLGQEALIFLVAQDTFITVNQPVAKLLELIMSIFGEAGFSEADLIKMIMEQYDLDHEEVALEIKGLVKEWRETGILISAESE